MAKYSYEFKKQVVDAHLRGEGGYTYLAPKYGVANRRQVLNWVHSYEQFGDDGLKRSRKQEKYSFEFKLAMVESYLSSEVSYQELALKNGIKNSALIVKWVNEFRIAGPDALRPRKKGRKRTLNKPAKDIVAQSTEQTPVDFVLRSSIFTRSMVFAYYAKAQLPFALFRDLFNDTAEFTLCYGLHDCSHPFFKVTLSTRLAPCITTTHRV